MAGPFVYGNAEPLPKTPFRMNFAPHLGMFRGHAGEDPLDQLAFMADQGFRAFEDNEMKQRPVALQEKMGQLMADRGMQMGVFVAHTIAWTEPSLASGDPIHRDRFLDEITASVDVAKRVGATWMTVVPGHMDLRQSMGYQTAHVVDALKRACEILEPHGLIMVLEPLNFRDHPGLFLSRSPQLVPLPVKSSSIFTTSRSRRATSSRTSSHAGMKSPISKSGTTLVETNPGPERSITQTCLSSFIRTDTGGYWAWSTEIHPPGKKVKPP